MYSLHRDRLKALRRIVAGLNSGELFSSNCWVLTSGEAVWENRPHMLLYIEGYADRREVSSRHEITWSSSAPFNSQAAAVGIRGAAGAVGAPGAVGILDRVRREPRAVAAIGVTG